MRAVLALCIVVSQSLSHAVADKEAWEMDAKTMGDQIQECGPKIAEALKMLNKAKTTDKCGFLQKICSAYVVDEAPDGIMYRSRYLSLSCVATQTGGTAGTDISSKLIPACGADKKAAAAEFMLDSFCRTSEHQAGSDSGLVTLPVESIIEALEKAAKETPKKDPTKDHLKNLPEAVAVYLDGKGYFAENGYIQVDCKADVPITKQRSHVLQMKVKNAEDYRSVSYESKYSFLTASEGDLIALPGKMTYNFQQQGHKDLRMLKILKVIDDMLCSAGMNKKIIKSKEEASKAFKAALKSFDKI